MGRTARQGLKVDPSLAVFLEDEALPGSGVDPLDSGRGYPHSSTRRGLAIVNSSTSGLFSSRRSTAGTEIAARISTRPNTGPFSRRSAISSRKADRSRSTPRTSTPRPRRCPDPNS